MGRRSLRKLFAESLETRRPLAADLAALDVNNDMLISPVDALMVINRINQASPGGTVAEAEAGIDCDTNADGVVSPQDVLGVINAINSGITAVPAIESVTEQVAVPDDGTSDQPIDSTPSDDAPTDGTPETPVDETPVDEAPVEDTPVDETPVDDTPVDDTPVDDTPVDEGDGSDDTSDDTEEIPADDDSPDSGDDNSGDDTTEDDPADNDDGCEHDPVADGQRLREALRDGLRGVMRHRAGLFERLDANDDGSLTSDEVAEAVWDKLVAADANQDGGVTQTELSDYLEARRLAAIEEFFHQLDRDDSGGLTSDDLPRLAWRLVLRADADADGQVSLDEFVAASIRHL